MPTLLQLRRPGLLLCWLLVVTGAAGVAAQEGWSAPAAADSTIAIPAAASDPRRLRVHALAGSSVVIDGRLDEAAWSATAVATDFILTAPRPGELASQRTEARVLYDATAIYVAMRMYDRPDSIATRLSRRDALINDSDWIHILIDSQLDRRSAFRFAVNPSGVKWDAVITNDVSQNANWDAVWDVATRVDSLGWTAEFRIPLSQLRFNQLAGEQVWGINFHRVVARNSERSYWAPTPPRSGRLVSLFGELYGLEGLKSPRNLELLPFTLGRVTRAPGDEADPFYRRNDPFWNMGADLKFGLSSNFTLTTTINPDFGQVEADPSEVNLSAFETFFPERRPFFLEGAEIFQLGNLFYSRRIGRTPQRVVSLPGGYAKIPESTAILGAMKLTGRTSAGWTIGALNAVTAREEAATVDALGGRASTAVEPLTNYGVLRVRRDLRQGRSLVGGILTATNRFINEGDDLDFLRSSAYTGAIGWRHRFADDSFQTVGYVSGSIVGGTAEAIRRTQLSSVHYFQRPDARHLHYDPDRTAMRGMYGLTTVNKIAGPWQLDVSSSFASPGYEANDLGNNSRSDRINLSGGARYNRFEAWQGIETWNVGADVLSGWTFGREHTNATLSASASLRLLNGWGGRMGVNRSLESLSTFALRGGPAMLEPGSYGVWTEVYSDNRKALSGTLWGSAARESETGNRSTLIGSGVTARPSAATQLSLSSNLSWNSTSTQYVTQLNALGERRYLLAHLDQKTFSITSRLGHAFTPNLTLEFYGQPFIGMGRFSRYRMVTSPRAERLSGRYHIFTPDQIDYDEVTRQYRVDLDGDGTSDLAFAPRDFQSKQFRSNLVLRWEYRPGSTLYIVWSQGRNESGTDPTFDFSRDVSDLFTADGTNVLLIKLSYWFSL